jgi:ketosteroid isomerase-like protein
MHLHFPAHQHRPRQSSKTVKKINYLNLAAIGTLTLAMAATARAGDDRRAAIEAGDAKFVAAVAKGDGAALAALYTEDAWLMPQNSEPIRGRIDIQAFVTKNILGGGIAGATLKLQDVFGSGNSATEVGEYDMKDKAGTVLDHGKYMVVWHKVGGTWLMQRDMFSSNNPPPRR